MEKYIRITNKDKKMWILPCRNLKVALCLYQPSSVKGKALRKLLPVLAKFPVASKAMLNKLGIKKQKESISEELRKYLLLYLFVEKYSKSALKPLKSFADGLRRDIEAIENAVAYEYSNGFVEGTNSRLKMIKRTMYGRCGKRLLEAKLRYMRSRENG